MNIFELCLNKDKRYFQKALYVISDAGTFSTDAKM